MDHALLIHTHMRHANVDSPESARRREHLFWLEQETREARRRRRRELARRAWNALTAFHPKVTHDRIRQIDVSDPRRALR